MRCKSGTAKKIQGVSIKRRLPLPLAHYLAVCSLRNRMPGISGSERQKYKAEQKNKYGVFIGNLFVFYL